MSARLVVNTVFTSAEEARINERAHRIAVVREAHQRARMMRPLLVGSDRLQKLDDLVKAIHDDPAVTRGVRRITGRVADLIDELLELLAVHNNSPSVVASVLDTPDASKASVGAAVGSGSPSSEPAAPSGSILIKDIEAFIASTYGINP